MSNRSPGTDGERTSKPEEKTMRPGVSLTIVFTLAISTQLAGRGNPETDSELLKLFAKQVVLFSQRS